MGIEATTSVNFAGNSSLPSLSSGVKINQSGVGSDMCLPLCEEITTFLTTGRETNIV